MNADLQAWANPLVLWDGINANAEFGGFAASTVGMNADLQGSGYRLVRSDPQIHLRVGMFQ